MSLLRILRSEARQPGEGVLRGLAATADEAEREGGDELLPVLVALLREDAEALDCVLAFARAEITREEETAVALGGQKSDDSGHYLPLKVGHVSYLF